MKNRGCAWASIITVVFIIFVVFSVLPALG